MILVKAKLEIKKYSFKNHRITLCTIITFLQKILSFSIKVGNELDANSLDIHKKVMVLEVQKNFSRDRG